MTREGAGERVTRSNRRYLARRIRLTTAAIVLVAILATAGIGTAVANEIPGTTTAVVASTTTKTSRSANSANSANSATTGAVGTTGTNDSGTAATTTTTTAPTTTSRQASTTSGATG